MKKLSFNISILLHLIPTTSIADQSHYRANHELTLPTYIAQTLETAHPIQKIHSPPSNSFILITPTQLWQLHLTPPKLQKLTLPLAPHETLKSSQLQGNTMYILSSLSFYKLDLTNHTLTSWPLPKDLDPHAFHLSQTVNPPLLAHPKGLWHLEAGQLHKAASNPLITADDLGFGFLSPERIWVLRKSYFLAFDHLQPDPQIHILQKAPSRFLTVQRIDDHFILTTQTSLLVIATTGELLRAIPLVNGRSLHIADIQSDQQAFLFQDGTLEIWQSDSVDFEYSYLQPDLKNQEIHSFIYKEPFITWLENGRFQLYQLATQDSDRAKQAY